MYFRFAIDNVKTRTFAKNVYRIDKKKKYELQSNVEITIIKYIGHNDMYA